MDNLQTRLLAGDPRPGEPVDLLERAQLHVERDFVAIGLPERFDESMLLFRRALGLNVLYRRVNVNRGRPAADTLSSANRERDGRPSG